MKEKYIPLAQLVKNTELLYATAKELLLGCFFATIFPGNMLLVKIQPPEPNSDQSLRVIPKNHLGYADMH